MADLSRDQRQHKRFKVPLEDLIGRLDDDQRVDIVDLSLGGIAIKSGSRLAVGREYLIRLHARRHSLEVSPSSGLRSAVILQPRRGAGEDEAEP